MIAPLRKRTLDGTLYKRDPHVEAQLAELAAMPQDELVTRCSISRRDDPLYVRTECLLYFVRASREDNSERHFERLYKILAERVRRCLPKPESKDGKATSLTKSVIRDKVFSRFIELLCMDQSEYTEKLDYFEVRFDGALASLRRDAQEQAWRDENRSVSIEFDDETGEPMPEVERAAGSYNPFVASENDDASYRSRLDAAIEALPPHQSRIVEMIRRGIPIDSKEAGAITIAKTLGKSEKTIRTHRDKAYAALRVALTKGEAP